MAQSAYRKYVVQYRPTGNEEWITTETADSKKAAAVHVRRLKSQGWKASEIRVRPNANAQNPSKRRTRKRVAKALTKYVRGQSSKGNPARQSKAKSVTIRDAKSVTLTRLPGGAVAVRVVKKRR